MKSVLFIYPIVFLLLGCLTEGDKSNNDADVFTFGQLSVGDKWEMAVNDKELKGATMSAEVTSSGVSYNSIDCYELAMKGGMETVMADEVEMKNVRFASKLFIRKSDFESVWSETTIEGTMKDEDGNDLAVKFTTEGTEKITGNHPPQIAVGKTWSLKTIIDETTKIYVNDDLIDNSDTSYVITKNFESKGIKSVTVPAGEFSSIEVRYDEVETGNYGYEYYSNQAKYTVKDTYYEEGRLTSTTELKTLITR